MPGTAGAWPDVPTLSTALFIPGVLGALTLHVSSQSTSLSPWPALQHAHKPATPCLRPRNPGVAALSLRKRPGQRICRPTRPLDPPSDPSLFNVTSAVGCHVPIAEPSKAGGGSPEHEP